MVVWDVVVQAPPDCILSGISYSMFRQGTVGHLLQGLFPDSCLVEYPQCKLE